MSKNYNPSLPNIDSTEVEDARSFPSDEHRSFLEKVMVQGGLADLYDARDITEVVFRTMRDMMTNEAVDHVAEELKTPVTDDAHERPAAPTTITDDVADLWQDTNPIVHFLSRVRPALDIRDTTFLFRIRQEASLPPKVEPERAVKAVFSATKDELSSDRIQEISQFLPGTIKELWQTA
jgi:uncharacterized protein (DUF2267 family)